MEWGPSALLFPLPVRPWGPLVCDQCECSPEPSGVASSLSAGVFLALTGRAGLVFSFSASELSSHLVPRVDRMGQR